MGVYLKNTKTLIQKDKCTPILMAALFATAKTWKQSKCPSMDERIKKIQYMRARINTHTERIQLSHKKERNSAICNNMDGP